MKKSNKSIVFLAVFCLEACTGGMKLGDGSGTEIRLVVNDFQYASTPAFSETKSSITAGTGDGGNVKFNYTWSNGDKLGVFPGEGALAQQMLFGVSIGEVAESVFEGSTIGWKLNPAIKYAAYFPLKNDGTLKPDQIQYSYSGQVQNGNGYTDSNLAHLGKYDYLISDAVYPDEKTEKTTFNLSHIGAIVRFKCSEVDAGKYTSLTLSTSDNADLFPSTVNLDLFGVQRVTTSSPFTSFTVQLEDFTVSDDNTARIWFMLPPTDLSGKKVNITLHGEASDITYQIDGMEIESSKAYDLYSPEYNPQKINSFTLVLDATAGGTVEGTVNGEPTMNVHSAAASSSSSITIPDITPDGPTAFQGWSETIDGDASLKSGSIVQFDAPGTKTIYAVYQKHTYTLTYVLDGGSIDSQTSFSQSVSVAAESYSFTVTDKIPEKDGWDFVKWENSNAEYKAGDTITLGKDTPSFELTAIWEEKQTDPYAALAVDLGLPSGTLWASCNLGAETIDANGKASGTTTTSNVTSMFGKYYAWGAMANATSFPNNTSKYNTGTADLAGKTDVVTQTWGGDWAIPTKTQFEELLAETTVNPQYQNGIQAYIKFSNKKDSSKYIILPSCGGAVGGGSVGNSGKYLFYWTSTVIDSKTSYAFYKIATSATAYKFSKSDIASRNKYFGMSIRPVKNPSK